LLLRPAFGREKLHQERLVPSGSILLLVKNFAQDWPLGFAENDAQKFAITFKVFLGVLDSRQLLRK
jgi:hypothetical protein